jgi:hypothetical protein
MIRNRVWRDFMRSSMWNWTDPFPCALFSCLRGFLCRCRVYKNTMFSDVAALRRLRQGMRGMRCFHSHIVSTVLH